VTRTGSRPLRARAFANKQAAMNIGLTSRPPPWPRYLAQWLNRVSHG